MYSLKAKIIQRERERKSLIRLFYCFNYFLIKFYQKLKKEMIKRKTQSESEKEGVQELAFQ